MHAVFSRPGIGSGSVRVLTRLAGRAVLLVMLFPVAVGAQASPDARPGVGDLKLLVGSVAHVITSPLRLEANDWLALPVAGAGLVVLSALDDEVRDIMRRNYEPGVARVAERIEVLGTVHNYGILVGFYAAALLFDDDRASGVAVEGVASSLVAAGVITPTLQYVIGRKRPRVSDDPYSFQTFSKNISFPSGHTTHAFAVASVIATEYDAFWVKAASYGLAGLVGLCRMYDDAHHLSDVTAAALIGTAVGRSVARYGKTRRGALSLQPIVLTGGRTALGLTLRF